MRLARDFVETGKWLFRWRSYLPLLLLGLVLLAFREYRYLGNSAVLDDVWDLFCMAVSFSGLAIRAYTTGHTPKKTSGRNVREQVAESLNTAGIYSAVRHPLYLGNFVIWVGISLFVHTWWLTLICILVFWLYYERIMFAEEEFLSEKFGAAYEEWAAGTPAFIPRLRSWRRPDLPFSLKTVLKREYNSFYAIILMFTFLEVVSGVVVEGKLRLGLMWWVILGTGTVVFLTLRTIRKKTRLLSTEGR
jgi:protein-S-isoprenylcysteine O-methyltransferase Ste14